MSQLLRYCFLICCLLCAALAGAQAPVADFTLSDSTGCPGLSVTATDMSSGSPTSWSWSFGNGFNPSGASASGPQSTVYLTAGTYTVTLTVSNASGTSAPKTKTVTVNPKPTVNFNAASTAGCLPFTAQLSSASVVVSPGPASYEWTFGDGTFPGSQANPSHLYTSQGPFDVNLKVTSGAGCESNLTKLAYITGWPKPIVSIGGNTELCNFPYTATFTNSSSGFPTLGYFWEFGDGGTSNLQAPTHNYTTGPTQTVKLTVTDGHNCKDSNFLYVNVYTAPAVITAPAAACEDVPVTFIDATPGATSSEWDYDDGSTIDAGSIVSHPFNSAKASYTVKLKSYLGTGGCFKTTTKVITINKRPVITMGFLPAIPCPQPSLVSFTATSSFPGSSFTWSFGDTHTASGAAVSNTYTANAYYTATVYVTTPSGCTDSMKIQDLPIRGIIPQILPTPESGCLPTFNPSFTAVIFSSLPPGPSPAPYPVGIDPASYAWSFPNGTPTTSTSANPSTSYTTPGPHTVTLNATSANGCPFTVSKSVNTDVTVPASFSASPLSVCVNDPVTFTNTSPNVASTDYIWDLGDDTYQFTSANYQTTFTHSYKKPGSYSVVHRTIHNGCQDTYTKNNYIVVNPPNADFESIVDCPPGFNVSFTDKSIGPTDWEWDFGDGSAHYFGTSSANSTPPPHSYAAAGTYQVTLKTKNTTFNPPCHDQITKPVTVFTPVANVAVNKRRSCKGEEVLFTGSLAAPVGATYSWIIDSDPATPYSTDNQLNYTFQTSGLHTVKLNTLYGLNSCLTSVTKVNFDTVTAPAVSFTASPLLGCSPLQVVFTDGSTATPNTKTTLTNWYWDFGDGTLTTLQNPTHSFTTGGYDIFLRVTDNAGCKDSLLRPAYVEARKPYALFAAADVTICAGEAPVFTNSSTGSTAITYLWNFGDGGTSTAKVPVHYYTAAGTYTVTLTVSDASSCSDVMTRSGYITVNAPKASFTMDTNFSICGQLKINFTNASTGTAPLNSFWNFGTGNPPQNLNNPTLVYTYGIPGNYTVTLVAVDAEGCKDSVSKSATLLGFNGFFSYTPKTGCLPLTVTFTSPTTFIPSYTWDFGDGTVLNDTPANVVTHTYTGTGPFIPKAVFHGGPNCNPSDSGRIAIIPDKVKADFTTSVPCADSPFTLTQTATAAYNVPSGWRWFFTPTDSANGPVVKYTFAAPGNHPVRMIATNGLGCSDTLTKNVFVNPKPDVDAGPADTGICPGDQARLIGHGALNYVWSSPTASVSCAACDTTYVSSAAPTTYYVIGTDIHGCKNIDSITARIQINTTADVKPGGDICIGESFRLSAAGATIYKWSPVRFLDTPDIASPLATPITTTDYVVEAQEGTCLVRYDTVRVTVHPTPAFSAGPDEWINYGSAVVLQPTKAGIQRIEWKPDSSLSCLDCFRPVAHPEFTTIYYAKAWSEWGCVDSSSVTVRVRCNGDSVFIPNTFSPNGDGNNDVFFPRGKGIINMTSMRVFNRWGELVFERQNFPINDEASGWDGSYKGKVLAPDSYIYTMQTRCASGEPVVWKGDITLIR